MSTHKVRVVTSMGLVLACSATPPGPPPAPLSGLSVPSASASAPPPPAASVSTDEVVPPPLDEPRGEPVDDACPAGMVHVVADRCPSLARKCVLSAARTKDNRQICQRFSETKRCLSAQREHLDYCIDRFEYPNVPGEHPRGLASWYDAATTCQALGKRLCWESEWATACEGPEELPFPSGVERDADACNIDLPAQMVLLNRLLSKDPARAEREYRRLDRSRRSGSMPGCISGYGVADLPGNFDEWVNADLPEGRGHWAVLMGGSWIRARNQCRARMSGHGPGFRFHALSFRCCADARGVPPREPPGRRRPPQPPARPNPVTWPGIDLATRGF